MSSTPDLAYYSYRHELIWRDQLYCDIAFCRLDEQAVLVHCTAVNQSDAPQQLALHMLASLHFPPVEPYHDTVLQRAVVSLPPTAPWINALDYPAPYLRRADLRAYHPCDGHTRGEVRAHGFVDGLGLGDGFGSNPGDSVTYTITLSQPLPDAVLLLRARVPADAAATLAVNGVPLLCAGTGDLACYPCALRMLPAGPLAITLTAPGAPWARLPHGAGRLCPRPRRRRAQRHLCPCALAAGVTSGPQAAHAAVTGAALPLGNKPFVDDGNIFYGEANIPAITHGPAATGAHTLNEAVTLDELVRVASVYALTALNFCAPA